MSPSYFCHCSLTQNQVPFHLLTKEKKLITNRKYDPNGHREHQPLESHFPRLENGLEEVEKHVLAKGGLIIQEVGPHSLGSSIGDELGRYLIV